MRLIGKFISLVLVAFSVVSVAVAQDSSPAPLTIPGTLENGKDSLFPPPPSSEAPSETNLSSDDALKPLPEKSRKQNDPPVSTLPPEEIPIEYLQEMDKVFRQCRSSGFQQKVRDCECYAMKFLDKRIETGPEPDTTHLLFQLEGACIDKPSVAGYSYGMCTQTLMKRNVHEWNEICTCFANKVAESVGRLPRISSVNLIGIRKNALIDCGLAEVMAEKSEKRRATYRAR